MADTTLKPGERTTASVAFLDDKNRPARVDGVPVWATGNTTAVTLTPAADGMSCGVAHAEAVDGDVEITCTADADMGAGVRPIVGRGTVSTVGGEAVTVSLTFSPVTSEPPIEPEGGARRFRR